MNTSNRKINRRNIGLRRLGVSLGRCPQALLVLACLALPLKANRAEASQGSLQQVVSAVQEGMISWYGAAFHDRPTASGERFDSNAMTMAHPTLPFGTQVRVTNLRNGRSVVLRVNDRGPHVGSRIGDVSAGAARLLGMVSRGVVRARIDVLI